MSRKYTIGGQAVLEGVMMRGPEKMAISVRQPNGSIDTQCEAVEPARGWAKIPFIRGVVSLVKTMSMSVSTLMTSAEMLGEEEEEPSRFEKWLSRTFHLDLMKVVTTVALILGLGLAVGLFFVLPTLAVSLIGRWVPAGIWLNLLEGVVRLLIFIGYMLLVSQMSDMKRVFMYHGAEHKTVNCYEAGLPLTPENAQTMSTANPRCGTSFMLFVMLISILVYSLTGWSGVWWTRVLLRLALLPVVASLSYELLMFLAKHEGCVINILRWPGMQMQKLTTRQPELKMLEVAIASFMAVLPEDEKAVEVAKLPVPESEPVEETQEAEAAGDGQTPETEPAAETPESESEPEIEEPAV